ncbi:MAG: ornithine cyclodeaminase family protein, partial [Alphaproteobacteria bacterium]|nr:ornithine cyclodeaminase family protein [Alphaproteobacteria bacterium]
AAAAISVKYLSREDSKILGIVGAGHQSSFQLRAVAAQRKFEKIIGWNLHKEMLVRLENVADELGLPFEAVELEQLGHEADVIVTITSCHEALLRNEWISPGTHLACMGTDTAGKQEIDPAILSNARVFTDEVAQAISIGECQHAVTQKLISKDDICPIGEVINGTSNGRSSSEDVTVFDGTGVGLQDLAVASKCYQIAKESGKAVHVSL